MTDYKQGDVTIDGVKIHYYRSGGKKPPFLLLHGVSDNGLCWSKAANDLRNKYDVIMVDAQGHGLSDRTSPDFSYESHARQLAGLIKALKLTKPLVMGHSMGAGTAADMASEYPTLPGAIILVDPPWSDLAPHPKTKDEAARMQQDFTNTFAGLGKRRIQDIIMESQKMDPAWPEEERLPWAVAKKQFDIEIFNSIVVNPHPFEEVIATIQCPTLLVTADQGVVSQETAEKIATLWKAKAPYKWVRIKGAGHNIHREQYAAFMQAIAEFLTKVVQ
jgi:N-formylmaleamate deformylase